MDAIVELDAEPLRSADTHDRGDEATTVSIKLGASGGGHYRIANLETRWSDRNHSGPVVAQSVHSITVANYGPDT